MTTQTLATPEVFIHAEGNGSVVVASEPVRLNLGAGGTHLLGFANVDRKEGSEVYPLPHADGSVSEIVASHVLEHFSHRDVFGVLSHWVEKLKPGGKIRLAVPDFEAVAKDYLAGKPVNVQGYTMGSHSDDNDFHGTIFDRESLTEAMITAGLERIGPWKSDLAGCSSMPYSLNLQGFKPSGPEQKVRGVSACVTTPRFGPLMHPHCSEKAFHALGIKANSGCSCYWSQNLSNQIEDAIAEPSCEFVLTLDFDTVYAAADVLELYRLLRACPDVDAVFPLQSKRGCEQVLFSLPGQNGKPKTGVTELDLTRHLLPANTGHFGLTLFRADSLRRFPRPGMVPQPNPEGKWRDGQVDADIDFWRRFKAAGFRYCLAPQVVVGHLEEVITWPGKDLKPFHQRPAEYDQQGIPAEVAR
jgi:hypothetical protein